MSEQIPTTWTNKDHTNTAPLELKGKAYRLFLKCKKADLDNFVHKEQYVAEAEKFCKKGRYYTHYRILDENLDSVSFTSDMISNVFQIME